MIGRVAARDHQRVEVLGAHVVDRLLDARALEALLAADLLARLHAHDHGLVPGGLDAIVGNAKFGVLELLTDDERYARHDVSPVSSRPNMGTVIDRASGLVAWP